MSYLLQSILTQSPHLLVVLGGIVLSIVYMGRCRLAATVALGGLGLSLFAFLGGIAFQVAQYNMLSAGGPSAASFARVGGIVMLLLNLVRAVGFAAVVAAVFLDRPKTDTLPGKPTAP